MRIALIDGDILVYRAGYAAQQTFYKFVFHSGVEETYTDIPLQEVIRNLKSRQLTSKDGKLKKYVKAEPAAFACSSLKGMINDILSHTKAVDYVIFLTGGSDTNYRFQRATIQPYKGNRTQPKPQHYETLRTYLKDVWLAEVAQSGEADDEIGILASKRDNEYVICSIDKDLDMLPGLHYNLVTKELYNCEDPGTLTLSSDRRKVIGRGLIWFYAQMLLGDSADNIPGIARYGAVRTCKLLENCKTEEQMIAKVIPPFKKVYKDKWREAMLEVADLLWIQREAGVLKSIDLDRRLPK